MSIQRNGQTVVGFALADDVEPKMRMTTAGGFGAGAFTTLAGVFVGGLAALTTAVVADRDPKHFAYLIPIGAVIGGGLGGALISARQRPV